MGPETRKRYEAALDHAAMTSEVVVWPFRRPATTRQYLTNAQKRMYKRRHKLDRVHPIFPVHIRLDRTPKANAGKHKRGTASSNETRVRK
jgi:hypothetical protein